MTNIGREQTFRKKDAVVRAELTFLLGLTGKIISARASDSMISIMAEMFQDSPTAQEMTLGRTKYAYYLCFGIAPYLENQLTQQVFKAVRSM